MPAKSKAQPKQGAAPAYVVAIGASAGGLEAIEAFFRHMPAEHPCAFVVIQHLSPDHKSLMVEILTKRTVMPVHRAEDGMRVLAGNVYLIPPKKNLTIFHGTLVLTDPDHSVGLNLPIDIFLRSLAEDQGEKAVAIIMSGTGSDGMRGVRAVKQAGGMIMVQSEASAKFDGMPRAAISTGLSDFVLAPDRMPAQLIAFTKHIALTPADDGSDDHEAPSVMASLFALLRDQCKVDFSYYKSSTVMRRIERRMTVNQVADIDDYVRFLRETPAEVNSLYRELLIGVTNFFRDPDVFGRLETEVIPRLIGATEGRELRAWVAGCSTGEEAYSLAMLIRECLERAGESRDVKVFATDVDREAIRFAATGLYPESVVADLPLSYLSKYFFRKDDHFQVSRTIREMVVFAQHNLIKDPPFTNIDLISCRNVLIYFQPALQMQVMGFFAFSLAPGGFLVLGTSETTGDAAASFDVVDAKYKIYRSKASSGAATAYRGPTDTRIHEMRGRFLAARRTDRAADNRLLERLIEAAQDEYLPTTIVVNDQLEIQHVAGNAEGLFRFPTGKPSLDLDRVAVRELAMPLATGIQRAFRERADIRFSGIRVKREPQPLMVDVHIRILPEGRGQVPLAAVFLGTAGDKSGQPAPPTASFDVTQEAEQRIRDLEQELQFARENNQATMEELETANEELQATNEELLASNEELQSTNEELQSTNEELHTVNAEYHSKIVELTELNNDVDNLLGASQIGTLLLDENLVIRRFSASVTAVFRLIDSDVGRPITHITHFMRDFDPFEVLRDALRSGRRQEWEVSTAEDTWYLMRCVPYAVNPTVFSGLVVTFVEISRLKRAEAELQSSQHMLTVVANSSPALIWMSGRDGLCNWFNEPWLNYTGRTLAQEFGDGWLTGVHPDDTERVADIYRAAFAKREAFDMEYRLRRHDGEYRWFFDQGRPRYDGVGRFEGYIGSCMDVTERRTHEEIIKKLLKERGRADE